MRTHKECKTDVLLGVGASLLVLVMILLLVGYVNGIKVLMIISDFIILCCLYVALLTSIKKQTRAFFKKKMPLSVVVFAVTLAGGVLSSLYFHNVTGIPIFTKTNIVVISLMILSTVIR